MSTRDGLQSKATLDHVSPPRVYLTTDAPQHYIRRRFGPIFQSCSLLVPCMPYDDLKAARRRLAITHRWRLGKCSLGRFFSQFQHCFPPALLVMDRKTWHLRMCWPPFLWIQFLHNHSHPLSSQDFELLTPPKTSSHVQGVS
jgi:hypothetical protein